VVSLLHTVVDAVPVPYDDDFWYMIRTNIPLERLMRYIGHRTNVVGSFPDGLSYLNLAVARLRHISDGHWSTHK